MTFVRVNPDGWTDNITPLTAAQLNQKDINQSRAIDGAAGGPYSPSSPVEIDGSGIKTDLIDIDGVCTVLTGGSFVADSGATFSCTPLGTFLGGMAVTGDQTWTPASAGTLYLVTAGDGTNGSNLKFTLADITGTGNVDGAEMSFNGSEGQAQTGSTDNNDGGNIAFFPGEPGTGGSLDQGGFGSLRLNGSAFAAGGDSYFACVGFNVAGSTTVTTVIPSVFANSTSSLLTMEVVARTSAAGKTYSGIRKFIVDMSSGGVLSSSAVDSTGYTAHDENNGFSLIPVLTVFGIGTDKLAISLQEQDGATVNAVVHVRIDVSPVLA